MKVVDVPIDEITPYWHNPRKNDKTVERLVENIRKFGFQVPLVLDKNKVVIAGHARLKAAKKPEMQTVPCNIVNLTEEEAKRFRISAFTTDKVYSVISGPKAKVRKMSIWPSALITLKFKPGYGYKVLEDTMRFADFPIYKSPAAAGQKLTGKVLASISIRQTKDTSTSAEAEQPSLFKEGDDGSGS